MFTLMIVVASILFLFLVEKQIVKGLGETLVGAYPGRAMSFITRKNNLKSPIVRQTSLQIYIKRAQYPSEIGYFPLPEYSVKAIHIPLFTYY